MTRILSAAIPMRWGILTTILIILGGCTSVTDTASNVMHPADGVWRCISNCNGQH
jgi:hypothetical protein